MMRRRGARGDDKKRRDEIEARNKADQAKSMAGAPAQRYGRQVRRRGSSAIETAIEAAKKANEGTDPDAIQRALDQLTPRSTRRRNPCTGSSGRALRRARTGGWNGPRTRRCGQ